MDTVTVKLALDGKGRVEIVDAVSPDLTPAAKVDLQRAFSSCAWAPRPADGEIVFFTTTWVRERVR